ncbi:MAG: hypothetical protein NWE79_05790 [Candidatus Bathyarchaeota archaeon]|nr:hypothetical protein [Candidatus Bathyarchaeota archaeon]
MSLGKKLDAMTNITAMSGGYTREPGKYLGEPGKQRVSDSTLADVSEGRDSKD